MVNQTYQNTTKISEEISPNTDSSSSLTFFILLNPIVQKSAVADLILSHIRNVHFIWYLGCTFNVKYSFSALNSCPLQLQYLLNFRSPSRMAISRSYPRHLVKFREKKKHFTSFFFKETQFFLDRHHAWRSLDPTLGISSPFVKKKKAF